MRITSKGQVTIPKAVRDKLGVGPGDDVGFKEEGGQMILTNEPTPHRRAAIDARFAKALENIRQMQADGSIEPLGMTVDEYMNEIRGYDEDANDPGFKRPA